jgi:hypothetical protein
MRAVLEIFAEKFIGNLMHTAQDRESHAKIIDCSLEVFQEYLANSITLRMLKELPQITILAHNHHFAILQEPTQRKQLITFYKLLTELWITDQPLL